ncbi:MAG: hypothetical protein HY046_07245, partial [Acidobacteria bacterium]|nr:hypothetical protein [Acidobacteriota bacterium]
MAEAFLGELTKAVDELTKAAELEVAQVAVLVALIGKGFGVKPDEVALLATAHGDKFLRFVVPEKLQKVGD